MPRTTTTINVARQGGAYVIKFSNSEVLNPESLRQVRDEIKRHLDAEERLKIVLDMEDVALLSSEAIGMIVTLTNAMHPRGGQLHLANISDETYTVFEIMKLRQVVKVFDTIPDAISAFAA